MSQRPRLFSLAVALLAGASAALSGASAQEKPAAEAPPAAQAPPAAVQPSNAPFMKPLGRLSMILGSVHFLRTLCGGEDAPVWRTKMDEILSAQAPNDADRRILVASFNNGYRAFESTYRKCTPAANAAVERYLTEGATLSREIGAKYGN